MKKIYLITSSIRAERVGSQVADYAADEYDSAHTLERIDLRDWLMPYLDDGMPSNEKGDYQTDGANQWAEKIDQADAFIFVTPEYNASIPAQLKTAVDVIYHEWLKKPALIVSYSGSKGGGASAAKHLYDILERLQMEVVEPVSLSGWGSDHHDQQQYHQQLSTAFEQLNAKLG